MAITPRSTADAVWQYLMATRQELIDTISTSPSRETEERIAVIEGQILDSWALDFDGLLLKLELLWANKLDGEGAEARHRRIIIADLRRLSA